MPRAAPRPTRAPGGLFFDHPRTGKLQGAVTVKQGFFFVFASFLPKKADFFSGEQRVKIPRGRE